MNNSQREFSRQPIETPTKEAWNSMRLRPHHLLCTQTFVGMGYNEDFVKNMTGIVKHLRENDDAKVEIVFSTDDVCEKCPHKVAEGLCRSEAKVRQLDGMVVKHFGIEKKSYVYKEVVSEIRSKITAEVLDDICGKCSWYADGGCRKKFLA